MAAQVSRVTVRKPRAAAMLKKLKKLQGQIENPAPILEDVGDVFEKSTRSRFYTQTSPTGQRWRPSKAARRKRRKTLVDRGTLRDSIEAGFRDDKLYVGTDVWYGRIHQHGGKIKATYRQRLLKGAAWNLRSLTTRRGRSVKIRSLIRSLLLGPKKTKARHVRLPARRFLGASKRDRKNTLAIMVAAIEKAMS